MSLHLSGHDFCGPGSEEHLEKHYPARNKLDQYCKEHDLSYKRGFVDYVTSPESDRVLMRQAYRQGGIFGNVVGGVMQLKSSLLPKPSMGRLPRDSRTRKTYRRRKYKSKPGLGWAKRRLLNNMKAKESVPMEIESQQFVPWNAAVEGGYRPYRSLRNRRAMPKRRGKNKRGYRKRRKSNKLSLYGLSKLMNAPRTFSRESTEGFTNAVGQYKYFIHRPGISPSLVATALADTGAGGEALGSTSVNDDYRIFYRQVCDVRNLSDHPMELSLYYFESRSSIAYSNDGVGVVDTNLDSIQEVIMNDLATGWKDVVLDADEASLISYTGGTQCCVETSVGALTPYRSKRFCEHFRILQAKKVQLKSGQTASFNFKQPAFNHNNALDTTKRALAYPKNRFLMWRIGGPLGRDTTNEFTQISTLKVGVGVLVREHIKIQSLFINKSLRVFSDDKESLTNDGEGPSAMTEVIDE